VIPARSKRGLGIEAQAKIAQNPYLDNLSKMNSLAWSSNVGFCLL